MNPQFVNQQPPGQFGQGQYPPPASQGYGYGAPPPRPQASQPPPVTGQPNMYNGVGDPQGFQRPPGTTNSEWTL